MSSPNILLPYLIIFFSSSFLSTISSSSSPLSTIAISHLTNGTLVCALVPSLTIRTNYDLNCTFFPSGETRNYPLGAVSFSAIAAGNGFLCALGTSSSDDTSVMVWWDFAHNPHNNSIPDAKRVYVGPTVSALSAGDAHVCGLIAGGSRPLNCWRWRHLPIPDAGANVAAVAVGGDFVCRLSRNGAVRCFGDDVGIVGREPAGNYTLVASGTSHACVVSADDDLVCWGDAPNVTKNVMPIDSLALGRNRTCALYVNGTVLCWGENVELPEDIAGSEFISIEARGDAFCGVLTANYSLVCWGSVVFRRKNVVFGAVLPGNCSPLRNCPCGVVPGSGTMCANNGAICKSTTCNRNGNRLISVGPIPTGRKNKRRFVFILVGSIGLGIGTVIGVCFLYFVLGYKKRRVHDSARLNVRTPARAGRESAGGIDRHMRHFLSKAPGSLVEEFPIKLLLRLTDGFSDECKIGSGSFGSVYRAALEDGRVVAIKRAEPNSGASTSRARTTNTESAFVSEIALLSRVNHKSLVRLLGYCKDCSELILVYEFMSNGTLYNLLHNSDHQLGWPARIQVALDAARGIEYLHTYAVPPIIHRDVKSSNILLDENWAAKVSDFGLSLMTDDDWSDGSVCTAGTVGYMDPEYYRLQHLTAKSDVYSFGVVLLEILSGAKVVQIYGETGSPKNVVDMVVPHIVADDINRVLDRRIALPTPSEMEAVAFVSYLASECVSTEGRNRPTMTEVVNGLERALAACTPRLISRSSTMGSR